MYCAIASRIQTTYYKEFAYTCHGLSVFLIPSWYVFGFAKSNRIASRWNEICSTLAPTQFSACAIRFHSRTRKVWAAMCSIFSIRKIISARCFYAWKESELFPPVNFNPRSYLSDADILFKPLLYDDNFDHSWGGVASLFFPESWYKCDSAEHAPSYVDGINLTPIAWSSPVTFSCIPLFLILKVLKNLDNMVNVKWSNLIVIEACTSGLFVRSASWQTAQTPCLDLDRLPRVFIRGLPCYLYSSYSRA